MDPYIGLAKNTIEEYIRHHKVGQLPLDLAAELLAKKAGVFVSIHKKSPHQKTAEPAELRGCIGTYLPTKPCLAQEIIDNAIAACSKDFRFSPVTAAELDELEINVDILSEPEPIQGLSSLEPKKYGVIVKSPDGRSGLLLPDLPDIDDAHYQVALACQKAGISTTEPFYLYRFTVERHKE